MTETRGPTPPRRNGDGTELSGGGAATTPRPENAFDAFLTHIEEEQARELISQADQLEAEGDRLKAEADLLDRDNRPGTKLGSGARLISSDELDAWTPNPEATSLREEAERCYQESYDLREEAVELLASSSARHLIDDRGAALAYLRDCLAQNPLPDRLDSVIALLESPNQHSDGDELELWAAADIARRRGEFFSASGRVLIAFLRRATQEEKREVLGLVTARVAAEAIERLVDRELRRSGDTEGASEDEEQVHAAWAREVAGFSDRHGLPGMLVLRYILLRLATSEEESEWDRIVAAEQAAARPPTGVGQRTLAEIPKRRISWLLPGRLARGEITMVNGWPGAGKTSAIVDMVARLSRGEGLPGDPNVDPERILYLATEDRPETLRLRFEAAGANLHMIDVPTEDELDRLRLPSGEREWKRYLRSHRIGVVVLDPLMGLIDGNLKAIGEQDMRRYMRSLRNAIEATGTAVLAIRHPNKASASGNVLAIASASQALALTAAARLEFLIAGVPDATDGMRAMATVKNNLSPFAPTLGFYIKDVSVPMKDGGPSESVAAVDWADRLHLTADDLMRRKKSKSAEALAAAKVFLEHTLADGGRPKKEIVQAAARVGLSERSLYRALDEIGQSDGNTRGATWSLRETDELRDEPPPDVSDLIEEGGSDEDD